MALLHWGIRSIHTSHCSVGNTCCSGDMYLCHQDTGGWALLLEQPHWSLPEQLQGGGNVIEQPGQQIQQQDHTSWLHHYTRNHWDSRSYDHHSTRHTDVSRRKCTGIQSELQEKLCELLPALPVDTDTAEHAWTVFRDAVFSAAETALGFCKRKHQDWFDQNDQDILTLIEAKRSAHAAWLSDKNSAFKHAHFKQLRGQVQSRTRELKNAWWADKATEVQNHADNKRSKEFYAGLKSIFGPVQCTTAPIRNRDGMLLTDKEDILKQWTLHFSTLLNRTSEVTDEALESIQQRPMITELDAPPNTAEADAAIKQLQTGKAPGPDGIPAEVFKAGGETLITHLTRMFQVFWANGQLPQDLRDANIIHLYKNKGDRSSCDNHRGISLLSIAGKILARIMLNRITKHILDDVVSESQCGFRKQRGTVDMVFAIRQLQEKCVEQHQDLHLLFIDLTKAFDTVNRAALWAILSKLGCPPRFVQIIRSFHDGMFCRVIENGDASDPFPVSNGVKQGCVLAPTLFSLLFAQMLSAALSQTEAGVKIHYRTDGDVFNLRRLKSYTKVTRAIVRDFLFADDCALAAHSEVDLQELADCFATAAKSFGLTVSIKKTEVLRQLAPNTARPPPNITMDGNALKNVDTFKYLGSGLATGGIPRNWTSFTCVAFAKFSVSAGRTMCQTRRSFAGLSSLALKPC